MKSTTWLDFAPKQPTFDFKSMSEMKLGVQSAKFFDNDMPDLQPEYELSSSTRLRKLQKFGKIWVGAMSLSHPLKN